MSQFMLGKNRMNYFTLTYRYFDEMKPYNLQRETVHSRLQWGV